jgi:hypothetical protein
MGGMRKGQGGGKGTRKKERGGEISWGGLRPPLQEQYCSRLKSGIRSGA